VCNGAVTRTIDVPYDASNSTRTYELFEFYNSTYAKTKRDQDSSFMVEDETPDAGDSVSYPLVIRGAQYVTLLVVPFYALDRYSLDVCCTGYGHAYSNSIVLVNWIQVRTCLRIHFSPRLSCRHYRRKARSAT
jgi:hypothetical protein